MRADDRVPGDDEIVVRPRAGRPTLRLGLAWLLALAAALVLVGRARAQDLEADDTAEAEEARATRDVATLASRETLLTTQATEARASARWRLRALYRLAVAGIELPRVTRALAEDAAARAVGRDLAEARALGAERERARVDHERLVAAARVEAEIGAPPALIAPVTGPVIVRFGVGPEHTTGLLVSRAGVRLAALPRQGVRAPAAGAVVVATTDGEGSAVMLDLGAGWTTIVGGLAALEGDVVVGARVAAGQRLGTASRGPAAAVTFEVWRGRHAVDPQLLVRGTAPALAAPAPLP